MIDNLNWPKCIGLEGVNNARQLGGYIGLNQKLVKENVLLRTGKLGKLTKDDKAKLLEQFNLKTIIDLRTDDEINAAPDPLIVGVERYHFDMIENLDSLGFIASSAMVSNNPIETLIDLVEKGYDFSDFYTKIVTSQKGKNAIKSVIEIIANQSEGAVLWHCSSGKDRCGTISAICLSLLGVDRKTVIEDYDLSNLYYDTTLKYVKKLVAEKQLSKDVLERTLYMTGVNVEYMIKTLNLMDEISGSVEKYCIDEIGISSDTIRDLRKRYLLG